MNPISPSAHRKNSRFAMQGLYQWQMTDNSGTDNEKEFLEENKMKKVDMVYFRELM